MKKMNRLPHEQATADGDGGIGPERDGLPVEGDVEGHRQRSGDSFLPGLPGTGGDDLRRPISGGEIDADDVEGHLMGHTRGERLSPGMPGTGGDSVRTPITVEVDPEA